VSLCALCVEEKIIKKLINERGINMYAYREQIILENPQKLILSKPLPLISGQSVEVLVLADSPATPQAQNTWMEFFAKRDRLLAECSSTEK